MALILKQTKIFQNNFSEIRDELINFLTMLEIKHDSKDHYFYTKQEIEICKNWIELQKECKDIIFAHLYMEDQLLEDLISAFTEIELISERDARLAKIAKIVFYTDEFPKEINDFDKYDIIYAIRIFKKYNEEF